MVEWIKAKQSNIYIWKIQVPDDRVPLTVCDVGVVREQDGVVGHNRFARGQDASYNVGYTVQDAVIHQEVVNQQLYRWTEIQIVWKPKHNIAEQAMADRRAYAKLLNAPLWGLRVVP